MNRLTLNILTWGTVVAAIVSALWLAAAESGLPDAGFVSAASRVHALASAPPAAVG